jgi:hypothetical protein
MTVEIARAGGALGAAGIALLVLARSPAWRFGGLVCWGAGCAALAVWLAPSGYQHTYAVDGVAGAVLAIVLAWLFVRLPWLLPIAVLGCVPAREPVSVGQTPASEILPIAVVVVAAALAFAWQLWRGDARARELGPFAWPLALFVAWSGIAFLWTKDVHGVADVKHGATYLLFYVLPFALVAVSLARIPWRDGWALTLYVLLAGMALAFAVVGIWDYATRSLVTSPKVVAGNAYATSSWFYHVDSVFHDPELYGRFLVVAILAGLVLVLFGPPAAAWAAAATAAVTWVGLVPSFSAASFVALAAGVVVALAALWRRRSILPLAVAVGAPLAVALGVPQARHRILGKAGISDTTDSRSKLVSNGIEVALHHPVIGVGTGGFLGAYAEQAHVHGKEPPAAASHDTPITVAGELGVPGLALLAWLLFAALTVPFRANPVRGPTGRARLGLGLALVAIVVHSLFSDALFEDPLFWTALALSAAAARADTMPERS